MSGMDASRLFCSESLGISTCCIDTDQSSPMRTKQYDLRIHPWNIKDVSNFNSHGKSLDAPIDAKSESEGLRDWGYLLEEIL